MLIGRFAERLKCDMRSAPYAHDAGALRLFEFGKAKFGLLLARFVVERANPVAFGAAQREFLLDAEARGHETRHLVGAFLLIAVRGHRLARDNMTPIGAARGLRLLLDAQ